MSTLSLRRGLGGVVLLQYLLLLGSESAWAYGWALMVGSLALEPSAPVVAWPVVGVVLLLSVIVARLAVQAPGHLRWPRLLSASLGLAVAAAVAFAGLPAAWEPDRWAQMWPQWWQAPLAARTTLAALTVVLLWWRGLSIGRSNPSLAEVESRFRVALFAISLLMVTVAMAGERGVGLVPDLLPLAMLIVAGGLLGMPLARIVDEGRRRGRREGAALNPGWAWIALLVTVVVGILAATLLLAQVLSFERIAVILEPLGAILDALLMALVYLVAVPLGLLLELVVFVGRMVLHPTAAAPVLEPPDMSWIEGIRDQGHGGVVAPWLLSGMKIGLAAALVLLLLAVLVRALMRLGERWQQDDVEELHDFVWSWPGAADLWRRWLRWLRAGASGSPGGCKPSADVSGEGDEIRRLYREFLRVGAVAARPRSPWETPLEYEGRLVRILGLPGGEEVHMITEGYLRVRYALLGDGRPDVGAVASALARLRDLWQSKPGTIGGGGSAGRP